MSTIPAAQPSAISVLQDRKAPIESRMTSVRTLLVRSKEKLAQACGNLMNADRLIQIACTSIRKNPELLDCTPASLFGAIAEAATYGWVPDGLMGQASLVPFNNRTKQCKEVALIPGYRGLRELVRRSGDCDTIMEAVHEGDEFQFNGPFVLPTHVRGGDPTRRYSKRVTGAYVVGRWKDGSVKVFCWTVDECLAHRDRYSQGWKRVSKDALKAKDSPWNPENVHEFAVMCMKTVLLDAIHRGEFPLSVEDRRIAMREPVIAEIERTTISGESLTAADIMGGAEAALEGPRGPSDAADGQRAPNTTDEALTPPTLSLAAQERLTNLGADLKACNEIKVCQDIRRQYEAQAEDTHEQAAIMAAVDARCEEIRATRGQRAKK